VLGFDIESTAAGVAATLDNLPGTALGTSIGAAIFLLTVGLGVAALVAPFTIRPPVAMLGASGAATALSIALCADGRLTRLDGAILLGAFVPFVAVIVLGRPRTATTPDERPARPTLLVTKVLGGLLGLLIGAELLVFGTRRIVTDLGLSESVFGLLVVAAAVSFEEVVLEALPAFRGFPELSVGNALGTLIFLLTGSLGIIALARPIEIPDSVTAYDLPALAVAALLACGLLARGRLKRTEGAVLLCAYTAYAVGARISTSTPRRGTPGRRAAHTPTGRCHPAGLRRARRRPRHLTRRVAPRARVSDPRLLR
jgi:cation:H+ antiporter